MSPTSLSPSPRRLPGGGAGIVTVGDSPVTQAYADENRYVVNLADPFVVHGLVKLTDAIHRYKRYRVH